MKPKLAEKDVLNVQEAIEYFTLSRRRFYSLLAGDENPGFIAKYGTRQLIIRSELQKYIMKHPELRRRGSYGD